MDHPASHLQPGVNGLDQRLRGSVEEWLAALVAGTRDVGRLLGASAEEQERVGSRYTLREIGHQPVTWVETASLVAGHAGEIAAEVAALGAGGTPGAIVLTGSGSSLYAGECLAPALQAALGMPVRAVPAGELLIQPGAFLPARGPCLVVSFGRSGNSPESCGAIDAVREAAPECRHLVVTCNPQGRLATRYRDDPRVRCVVLDDKTNDRSLVMTSSFTNMVLAVRLLGMSRDVGGYLAYGATVARAGAHVLLRHSDALAGIGRGGYGSAVYLGSGCRHGSAREAALKMLEMTDGRVKTFTETYLGLRHGPMCAIDDDALVVCFLASDPVTRAYEVDLVRELGRKELGGRKVVVGHDVPAGLASGHDVVVDVPELEALGDSGAPLLDVLVGQLLAVFRCLALGLRPDMPADDGVINRVVQEFALHRRS
ncbi:MAG TPA: tagatose-6-phosphate ketose isomerase [Vicinamibacteria bacterium]|nr:tagatose-6-phosphate ketose isomerase [Vicinamibacteria bacterium]